MRNQNHDKYDGKLIPVKVVVTPTANASKETVDRLSEGNQRNGRNSYTHQLGVRKALVGQPGYDGAVAVVATEVAFHRPALVFVSHRHGGFEEELVSVARHRFRLKLAGESAQAFRQWMLVEDVSAETRGVMAYVARQTSAARIQVSAQKQAKDAFYQSCARIHRPAADGGDVGMLGQRCHHESQPVPARHAVSVHHCHDVTFH